MGDIVIEIRGGVLAAVYSDIPDVRIVSIDWDDAEASTLPSEACGIISAEGVESMPDETYAMYVLAQEGVQA